MNRITTSKGQRERFLERANFETTGTWGIPLIHKQTLDKPRMGLISYSDTRCNDLQINTRKGVHFFY